MPPTSTPDEPDGLRGERGDTTDDQSIIRERKQLTGSTLDADTILQHLDADRR